MACLQCDKRDKGSHGQNDTYLQRKLSLTQLKTCKSSLIIVTCASHSYYHGFIEYHIDYNQVTVKIALTFAISSSYCALKHSYKCRITT